MLVLDGRTLGIFKVGRISLFAFRNSHLGRLHEMSFYAPLIFKPHSHSSPQTQRQWFDRLLIRADNRDALQLHRLTIVEHSFLNKDVRGGDVHILPYCHTENLSSTV